jgi:hypothetical protein
LKYDVFICYKQNTAKDYALALKNGLKEILQITAFLDDDDIPKRFRGTDKWWEFRDQAIRDCSTFLMIVTHGFEKSVQIKKEITLALEKEREFMCLRYRKLPSDIPIELLMKKRINLNSYLQIPFSTPEELLRGVLDNLEKPMPKMAKETPLAARQLPAEERLAFPLVHFDITQAVQSSSTIKRILPNVGFNMRSWSDLPIMAKVEARVLLGGKDLGLVRGSQRGGKYVGYYDGRTLWNLNPYNMVFGNFNIPSICAKTDEDLRIEVQVTLADTSGRRHKLLPVSWTFMRNRNDWFFEPTGDC